MQVLKLRHKYHCSPTVFGRMGRPTVRVACGLKQRRVITGQQRAQSQSWPDQGGLPIKSHPKEKPRQRAGAFQRQQAMV